MSLREWIGFGICCLLALPWVIGLMLVTHRMREWNIRRTEK